MRIEILTVPQCPHGPLVEQRLAEVLAGRPDVMVERRVAETPAQAGQYGMCGSPTVLIDGRDPFPAMADGPSLSCRLYRDERGQVQGAPSTGQLRAAVAAAEYLRDLGRPVTPGCRPGPGRCRGRRSC
jgi:hypothetical protein